MANPLRAPGSPLATPDAYRFLSPALGVVLVAIPKNGCSAVKAFLLRAEGRFDEGWAHGRVHAEAAGLSLANPGLRARAAGLPATAFLRDPLLRVASAFRNKLVRPRLNLPAVSAIESAAELAGATLTRDTRLHCAELGAGVDLHACSSVDYARGLSFREFVGLLGELPDERLDAHWRSQAWFLAPGDRAVPLERLSAELARLAPGLALAAAGMATTDRFGEPEACLADVPSGELATSGRTPTAAELYEPGLIDRVLERFAADARLFEAAGGEPTGARLRRACAAGAVTPTR